MSPYQQEATEAAQKTKTWLTASLASVRGSFSEFMGFIPLLFGALILLKDTDGDGKADLRRKVFTGFRKFNVQAVMNNLVWGLDNHIHGAGGSNGGQNRPGDKPEAKPLVMTRNDFRFGPVTEQFELLSGGARFGGTFDDWVIVSFATFAIPR